jgi:hydroxypyruvate isomerase
VVRAIDADNLRLMFDAYHCQLAGGRVVERIQELFPLIAHVQVADPPSRHEPGTGDLNWHAVFGCLRDLGYDRWVGCEYRPLAGTVAGLGWRSEFGFPVPSDPKGQ